MEHLTRRVIGKGCVQRSDMYAVAVLFVCWLFKKTINDVCALFPGPVFCISLDMHDHGV